MDTFGNLIQGGIGIFEVQGDEIRTVYINEGAYALIFGKKAEQYEPKRINLRHIVSQKDYDHYTAAYETDDQKKRYYG